MIPDKFNENKEELLPIIIKIAANKTRTASGGGTEVFFIQSGTSIKMQ